MLIGQTVSHYRIIEKSSIVAGRKYGDLFGIALVRRITGEGNFHTASAHLCRQESFYEDRKDPRVRPYFSLCQLW